MAEMRSPPQADAPGIVIIADDLSSATDCAVQMASGGYRAAVPLRPETGLRTDADIVAFDTDSRGLPAEQAYTATRSCLARQCSGARTVFYKSMDSTLRGNLGAEIDAILANGSFDVAVVAPAFPTYGRTTSGGHQFVNGTPVHESEFGTDPTTPVKTSSIAARIATQCRRRIGLVPLAISREGPRSIQETVRAELAKGVEMLVFDVALEDDLAGVATAVGALALRTLWVGSTGLSRYVPAAIGLRPRCRRPAFEVLSGCVLIVAGSASETTRRQLDTCARRGNFTEIRLATRAIIRGGRAAQAEQERARVRLDAALREQHGAVALTLTSTRADVAQAKSDAVARGMATEEAAALLVHALGELTADAVAQGLPIKGLVTTGGSTAKTLAARLGADAIDILNEIEPGIPLGRLDGRCPMLIVTKAGGFGSEESLAKAVQEIRAYGRD